MVNEKREKYTAEEMATDRMHASVSTATESMPWDYHLKDDDSHTKYRAVGPTGLITESTDFSTASSALIDAVPLEDERGTYRPVSIKIDVEEAQVTSPIDLPGACYADVTGFFDVTADVDFIRINPNENNPRNLFIDAYGSNITGENATSPGYGFDTNGVTISAVFGSRVESMASGANMGFRSRLEGMSVSACSVDAINIRGSDTYVARCEVSTSRRGMRLTGGGHRIYFVNSYLNNSEGFYNTKAGEVFYVGCHADENALSGFRSNEAKQMYLGCTARNNGTDTGASDKNRSGWFFDGDRGCLVGCDAIDDQSTTTQQYGYFNGETNTRWVGNGANGNALGAYANALDTTSVSAANIPTLS